MALGASRPRVIAFVGQRAAPLALLGITVGACGALLTSHVIRFLLYGLTPSDPRVLVAIVAVMLAMVVVSTVRPARRAAAVDPVRALQAG